MYQERAEKFQRSDKKEDGALFPSPPAFLPPLEAFFFFETYSSPVGVGCCIARQQELARFMAD